DDDRVCDGRTEPVRSVRLPDLQAHVLARVHVRAGTASYWVVFSVVSPAVFRRYRRGIHRVDLHPGTKSPARVREGGDQLFRRATAAATLIGSCVRGLARPVHTPAWCGCNIERHLHSRTAVRSRNGCFASCVHSGDSANWTIGHCLSYADTRNWK